MNVIGKLFIIISFLSYCFGEQLLPTQVNKVEYCRGCKKIVKAIRKYSDDPMYDAFNIDKACNKKYFDGNVEESSTNLEKSCFHIMQNYYDELQNILEDINTPTFTSKLCNEITMACMGLTLPEERSTIPSIQEEDAYIRKQLEKHADRLKVVKPSKEL